MARCTACDLVHPLRADWQCPRCNSQVDLAAPRPIHGAPDASDFPTGSRVSGAVFVTTGVLALLQLLGPWSFTPAFKVVLALGSAVVCVLGLLLLWRLQLARRAAFVLLGLGLLTLVATSRHPGVGALIGITLAGHVLLLLGEPGRGAIAFGVLLTAPPLLLGVLSFFAY